MLRALEDNERVRADLNNKLREETARRIELERQIQQTQSARTEQMRAYADRLSGQLQRGETPTTPNGQTLQVGDAHALLADIYKEMSQAGGQPLQGAPQQPGQPQQTNGAAHLTPEQEAENFALRNDITGDLIRLGGDPNIVGNIPDELVGPISALRSPGWFTSTFDMMLTSPDPTVVRDASELYQKLMLRPDGTPRSQHERFRMVAEMERDWRGAEIAMRLERNQAAKEKEPARGPDGKFISKESTAKPSGKPEDAGVPAGRAASYAGLPGIGEDESIEEFHARRDRELAEEMMQEAEAKAGNYRR